MLFFNNNKKNMAQLYFNKIISYFTLYHCIKVFAKNDMPKFKTISSLVNNEIAISILMQ